MSNFLHLGQVIPAAYKYLYANGQDVISRNRTRWDAGYWTVELHGMKSHGSSIRLPFDKETSRVDAYQKYSQNEMIRYLLGLYFARYWSSIAKMWAILYPDPDSLVNSAYGMIFKNGEYDRMLTLLKNDSGSTRAGVSFNITGFNQAYSVSDQPCSIFFTARVMGKRLYTHYAMRSTDIKYGLPHDIIWAMNLSSMIAAELLSCYSAYVLVFSTSSLHTYDDIESVKEPVAYDWADPFWCRGTYEQMYITAKELFDAKQS